MNAAPDPQLEAFIASAYDDLRARARRMAHGAPPTLAGTAAVNAVLEKILKNRKVFRDERHFTGYCIVAIRHLWMNHRDAAQARVARDRATAIAYAAAGTASADAASEDAHALRELIRALREDRTVRDRRKMARAAELCLLAGFSNAEAAKALGKAKSTVQKWLAAFRAWAEVAVAPRREQVEQQLEALLDDADVARRANIAEAVRRCWVRGEPRDAVARALRTSPDVVARDLRLFRAWVAERAARLHDARGEP